jgi:thioredoxin-related protein
MNHKCSIIFILFFSGLTAFSQPKLYNPAESAKSALDSCIQLAKKENKHVLVQVGGNWCKWCIEFHRFVKSDNQLDSILKSSFIYYPLNYSKENKNLDVLASFEFPQRFGFPVFVVLNENGKKIHIQNSSYLEDGKESYDQEKVFDFFKKWTPKALNPSSYK